MSQPSNEVTTIALLTGSYFNVFFYTIELALFIVYTRSKEAKRDPFKYRLFLFISFVFDTVSAFAACALVYGFVIKSRHSAEQLANEYIEWPYGIIVGGTAINALAVQDFMIYRYHLFSRNDIMTYILLVLAALTFCATIVVSVSTYQFPRFQQRRNIPYISTAFGLRILTDTLIMIFLIRHLLTRTMHHRETRKIVKSVIAASLSAGLAPVLLTLGGIIGFAIAPGAYISTACIIALGSVYVITMLFTLNIRSYIRGKELWVHAEPSDDPETGDESFDAPRPPRPRSVLLRDHRFGRQRRSTYPPIRVPSEPTTSSAPVGLDYDADDSQEHHNAKRIVSAHTTMERWRRKREREHDRWSVNTAPTGDVETGYRALDVEPHMHLHSIGTFSRDRSYDSTTQRRGDVRPTARSRSRGRGDDIALRPAGGGPSTRDPGDRDR